MSDPEPPSKHGAEQHLQDAEPPQPPQDDGPAPPQDDPAPQPWGHDPAPPQDDDPTQPPPWQGFYGQPAGAPPPPGYDYPPPGGHPAPDGHQYDQGYPQGYDQGYDQGYGQGYAQPPADPRYAQDPRYAYGPPGVYVGPRYYPEGNDTTWGAMCYVLDYVVGFLGPLIIYFVKKNEAGFVRFHAAQALNTNITRLIYLLAVAAVTIPLVILTEEPAFLFLFLPLWLFVVVAGIVFTILGAIKASKGEFYRFPVWYCFRMVR